MYKALQSNEMSLKIYKHAPAHLFVDEHVYFFTGAVYQKKKLLVSDTAKQLFLKYLFHFIEKYGWKLLEWVVLDNHYHFLAKITCNKYMPVMINSLHKTSAFHIKKILGIEQKPFWYQYWDRCIRNEEDYYRTAMYILYNPVKHGYVEDLKDYPYSSFLDRFQDDEMQLRADFMKYRPQDIKAYDAVDGF